MCIVIDLSIPSSETTFGEPLSEVPDIRVLVDRIVPVERSIFPYVWVSTSDYGAFNAAMHKASSVETFQLVQQKDSEKLYRVEWRDDDAFLNCLGNINASVLEARGTAIRWEFSIRFDTYEDLSRFQQLCSERGSSPSIERVVSDSASTEPNKTLSQSQREAIELALKRGYFDVPRRTTTVKLAKELGISDQAVSARIRRGMKKLSQRELAVSVNHSGSTSPISRN